MINGRQCILSNDLHIIRKGQRPLHVFLAFIQQAHPVRRVEVPLLLGRREQAGRLSDRCTLGFQFEQSRLKAVEALPELLSLNLLVVADRPRVGRVGHGEGAHGKGENHRDVREGAA